MPKPDLINGEEGFITPWIIFHEDGLYWITRPDSRDYIDYLNRNSTGTLRIYRKNDKLYFCARSMVQESLKKLRWIYQTSKERLSELGLLSPYDLFKKYYLVNYSKADSERNGVEIIQIIPDENMQELMKTVDLSKI